MKISIVAVVLLICTVLGRADDAGKLQFPKNLNIVSRKDWGANPPVLEMKAQKPEFITIHHTATKQKPEKSVSEKLLGLQKFSQNEGTLASGKKKPAWPDVPYHFYITCKGEIAEGRDLYFVGDTNTEYDPTGHILVTLEGNFEEEEPTDEQMQATRNLVGWLAKKFKVPAEKIKTHKDYAQTACPGKNLHLRAKEIRESLK